MKFTRLVFSRMLIYRAFDIMLVCWSMKVVMNGMNKTYHYQIENLFKAMNRPKGVGLLTICNHVSVLDSASLFLAFSRSVASCSRFYRRVYV